MGPRAKSASHAGLSPAVAGLGALGNLPARPQGTKSTEKATRAISLGKGRRVYLLTRARELQIHLCGGVEPPIYMSFPSLFFAGVSPSPMEIKAGFS